MGNYTVIRSPDYLEHSLLDKLGKIGKAIKTKKPQSSSKKEKSKSGDSKVRESGVKGKKSKYEGGFITKGDRQNNSQAYNHDYYIKNKWRWSDEFRDGIKYLDEFNRYDTITFSDGSIWIKINNDKWASYYIPEDDSLYMEYLSSKNLYRRYDKEIDKKTEGRYPKKENPVSSFLKDMFSKTVDLIPDGIKDKANAILEKVGIRQSSDTFIKNIVSTVNTKLAPSESEQKLFITRKHGESTIEEDMAKVNPHYYDSGIEYYYNNGSYADFFDYATNCALCTMTYDLRRKGYDVTAARASTYIDIYPDTLETFYKNKDGTPAIPTVFHPSASGNSDKSAKELYSYFEKQGANASGMVTVYWNSGGGHAMAWQNDENGTPYILDTQTNTRYSLADFSDELAPEVIWDDSRTFWDEGNEYSEGVRVLRTDDKDVTNEIKNVYVERGTKEYVNENVKYKR